MPKIKKFRNPLEVGAKGQIVLHIIMLILVLVFVLPVLLVYIISFSSEESLRQVGYSFFPTGWSISAYTYYFAKGMSNQIVTGYTVTLIVAAVGTFLSVTITSMLAYALSRKSFKLRKGLAFFVFFTMLFNGGLVPSYIVNSQILHINDTILILIASGMVTAYNTIVLRTFISSAVPNELIESAKIDGAREWTIFLRIVVPLAKPGIATIAFFALIAYWNDWFTGLVYINNPNLVSIQYLLNKIMNGVDYLKQNAQLANSPEGREALKAFPTEAGRMALSVIVMTPMLFAYPFFQKYFVKGLTIGGVKG